MGFSGIQTTAILAAFAAIIPFKESSITKQFSGLTFIFFAALKNTAGCGFPCVSVSADCIASKYSFIFNVFKTASINF